MKKIAVILGTSSGLGLAIARSLLRRGFVVYGGSRRESTIEHENFIDIEMDITQKDQVKNFVSEILQDTEVVDLIVNTAGMCEMNSVDDTTDLDLRMHFETNVIGYFNLLKEMEPLFIPEETHLINIFSISARACFPNTLAYTISEFSKKAMIGVFEKEWIKHQLKISNISVGAIDTPLWDEYSEVERDKMLSISDFMYMFDAIVDSPANLKFPDVTLLHKEGYIE